MFHDPTIDIAEDSVVEFGSARVLAHGRVKASDVEQSKVVTEIFLAVTLRLSEVGQQHIKFPATLPIAKWNVFGFHWAID